MNRQREWFQRNDRRIEWGFVAVFGALLLHAIADVSGLLGDPGFRPRAHLVLTAGMFLGPVAALMARRSRGVAMALALVSIVLTLGSLRVPG